MTAIALIVLLAFQRGGAGDSVWETFSVFSPLCSGAAWTIRMVSASIIVRMVSVYLGGERSPRWICSRELVCCRSDAGRRLPPGLFELWRCTGCRDCGPQGPCCTSLGLRGLGKGLGTWCHCGSWFLASVCCGFSVL